MLLNKVKTFFNLIKIFFIRLIQMKNTIIKIRL